MLRIFTLVRNFISRFRMLVLYLCIVIISLIAIGVTHINPELIRPGTDLILTIQSKISAIQSSLSNAIGTIGKYNTLLREYEDLLQQVNAYSQIRDTDTVLRQELVQLREIVGFSEQHGLIAAKVVGKDPGITFDTLVINKGKTDSISEFQPVISFQNRKQALVGKIIRAEANHSIVEPLFNYNNYVSARIIPSQLDGLMVGSGTFERPLHIRYVASENRKLIEIGDKVETAGLGSVYPPEIPIGEVYSVDFRKQEATMEIKVKSIINFNKLKYVFIITS